MRIAKATISLCARSKQLPLHMSFAGWQAVTKLQSLSFCLHKLEKTFMTNRKISEHLSTFFWGILAKGIAVLPK